MPIIVVSFLVVTAIIGYTHKYSVRAIRHTGKIMKRYLALQKIVEVGSFAKAAELMGYTQSALSQIIASLEDEIGIKLLIRSRTGSALTDEGRELFPYIEKTINQYNASLEKIKDIKGLKTGIIRMTTVTSISMTWLPQVIKDFHGQHPEVEFIMRQGDYTMIEEWVKSGAVDFGFVSPEHVKGIEIYPLKKGFFSAVLPKNHPLTQYDIVPLEKLAKEQFIMLEIGHHSECEAAFRDHALSPNVRYNLHDDYSILAMVEQNLGVSLLADLIIDKMQPSFDIVKRPVTPQVSRTVAIGYKSQAELSMASLKFIECLKEHLNQLP